MYFSRDLNVIYCIGCIIRPLDAALAHLSENFVAVICVKILQESLERHIAP